MRYIVSMVLVLFLFLLTGNGTGNQIYAGGCTCGAVGGNACHSDPYTGDMVCTNAGDLGEFCCYGCSGGGCNPGAGTNYIGGQFESLTCTSIDGIAVNAKRPQGTDQSIFVAIKEGNTTLATIQTNVYRPDFNTAWGFTGNHGFHADASIIPNP